MATDRTARVLHDVGLAAWFGGSLMGAIGVNGAANDVADPTDRARAASAGWARWAPWNALAVGAHLTGGALIVRANRGRVVGQEQVASWTTAKTALTGAALAATAYGGFLGRTVQTAGTVPAEGGAEPAAGTPPETASAMTRLRALQWVIPVLTGGVVVASAVMGEQQRPAEVLKGSVRGVAQRAREVAAHPSAAAQAVRAAS